MPLKKKALQWFTKGKLKQAEKCYLQLHNKIPNDPETCYMLGVIYGQTNHLPRAEKFFQKAIDLYPQSAMSYCGLATVYKLANPDKAAELFLKAYQLNPNLLDAYYEYAAIQYKKGEYETTSNICFELLKKSPDYAKANLLLGNIKLEQRDDKSAIQYYNTAIQLNPEFGEAHLQLGNACFRMGQLEDANKHFEQSVKFITPEYDPYIPYSRLLFDQGKIDEAENLYRKALKIDKNNLEAIAGIASVYEYREQYDKANDLLFPIIKRCKAPSINIIGIYEKLCTRFSTCDLLIKYINFVESQNIKIDWKNRCIIYFIKARVYEKLGNYEQAFTEYKTANELVPNNYDRTNYELDLNKLKSVFTYNYMLTSNRSASSERFIFIVGMPRSGTSLVEQILDSHPDVYGAGELVALQNMVNTIHSGKNNTAYPQCMINMDESTLQHYADCYADELKKLSTKNIIVDKMPHNFLHLGLISQLFPKSKIIHCKRHPLDTCLSIYFQNFNDSHSYANNLSNLAHHYKIYSDIMQHWHGLLNQKIYTVEYEAMVNNFETQSRSLISFCDLDWHDSCAEFYKNKRHVGTASQNQVNKPIYRSSIARWEKYESHLTELIDELKKYKLMN